MKPSRSNNPVVEALIAEHGAVNAGHDAARSRLLNCLPPTPRSERSLVSPLGWIGLGALASAAVLLFWGIGATSPAAAMERMAREVERVRSLSYRMAETSRDGQRGRLVESVYEGKWRRQPLSLWGTMKIWVTEQATGAEAVANRKQTVDVWEAHRANEEGAVVDHLRQRYWRTRRSTWWMA